MRQAIVVVTLLIMAAGMSGCVFAYRGPEPGTDQPANVQPTGLPGHDEQVWTDGLSDNGRARTLTSQTFIDLAESAYPAVVNIFSQKNIRTAVGDPLGIFRVRTPNLDFSARALGTGFFISPDGFMLTNAHVVAGFDEIKILLWQENEVKPAQVIGLDRQSDLALLKVEHDRPLPYLPLADSDAVRVGELVVAIGNPFGLQHSLTDGLISAKHRRLHEGYQGRYEDFLQTSAQINPGNSGGPLVNLQGQVVGVNTATVQGGQGIGFAVPADLVKNVIPHLIRYGRVRKAFIGVQLTDLSPSVLTVMPSGGALVVEVKEKSPASRAGLQVDDVIVELNGRQVRDATSLAGSLSLLIAERPAKLVIYRNRKKMVLQLIPTEAATAERSRR